MIATSWHAHIATGQGATGRGNVRTSTSLVAGFAVIAVVLGAALGPADAVGVRHRVRGASTAHAGVGFPNRETAYVTPPTLSDAGGRPASLSAHRWNYTRVTLLKDTPHVGSKGDVAIVNRNYAFNYLVPFGFARYTTRAELVGITLDKDYKEALLNVRKASAMHLKTRLGTDTVLHFETPAAAAGSDALLAPLLPIHIIDKMREKKLLIVLDMLREQDVKILTEDGVISTFGVHRVLLNVDPEIEIQITADVKEQPVDTSFLKDVVL
ncbi:ribosomal protein L9 [Babesia caballi]|uniref:Ribosomal protein L9 n=1 Tax=Babesia caballi TaxID=5871 RepID=A0AAV4LMR0_BABCB|nr:ribosomal protein L9 [Babesia caballi]